MQDVSYKLSKRMVQALILAAGRGSRMKNFTDQSPKCLVKIGGKSLLEWQIAGLEKAGVNKVYIATGYLEEQLRKKEYPCLFNPLWNQTNMVATLCCASELLMEDETIISYSDIAFSEKIVTSLLKASSPISITYDTLWKKLWQMRFEDPLIDAETLRIENGFIKEIGKKGTTLHQIEGQFMGLLKFSPEGWKTIYQYICSVSSDKKNKMQMTELLQYLVELDIPVQAIATHGKWCEVDSPQDLALYEKKLQTTIDWDHDWRN